jgi:hypothetical protein
MHDPLQLFDFAVFQPLFWTAYNAAEPLSGTGRFSKSTSHAYINKLLQNTLKSSLPAEVYQIMGPVEAPVEHTRPLERL